MQKEHIIIALADDDEDDRLFFKDAFDELKINTVVSTHCDGEELMNYLHQPETILPNILFLDLNMPRKNGFECLFLKISKACCKSSPNSSLRRCRKNSEIFS